MEIHQTPHNFYYLKKTKQLLNLRDLYNHSVSLGANKRSIFYAITNKTSQSQFFTSVNKILHFIFDFSFRNTSHE